MGGVHQVDPTNLDENLIHRDPAQLSAFGQQLVAEETSLFENKFISSPNETFFEYRIWGAIANITNLTGIIAVGDVFTGATSDRSGTVTAVNGTEITYDTKEINEFIDGETLTFSGPGGGATADLVNHDTGAHIYYDYYSSAVFLKTGTRINERALIQSIRYPTYISGQGHRVLETWVPADLVEGREQLAGYFDDLNGTGSWIKGTDYDYFIRTNAPYGAGWNPGDINTVPIKRLPDELTGAEGWNFNRLDNKTPPYFKLDPTRNQLDFNQIQWLGLGQVTFGKDYDGYRRITHNENHANKTTGVYMRTPSLPVRLELNNYAAPAVPGEMTVVCQSVATEGKLRLPGVEYQDGLSIRQGRTVTNSGYNTDIGYPVFAMRLANEYPAGQPNRQTLQILKSELAALGNDLSYRIYHVHTPNSITGTWTPIDHGVEVSKDITAFTGRHLHRIGGTTTFAGVSGKGGNAPVSFERVNNHSYLNQNYESDNSQMFVVTADNTGANATAVLTLDFLLTE